MESGNSPYKHRHLALEVFNRIFKSAKVVYEFYVNYDCDVNSENIFEKITDVLSRIAQGKYSKSTFSVGMQPAQDLALRNVALETLVDILRLISKSIDDNNENETDENNLKEEIQEEIGEEDISKIDNQETFSLVFISKKLILLN